ncbi:GYDIA family GHMP kinase [Aquimarina sp. 2201CG5-10]|uniref:GYDIA family GHMP kinase n=1 Tax=Aquimarina callyspongiae TaxID=3098150 RepID=UPI002AB58422|nr:GYDIA family GHMP kinase [Aquimarina sp. 2201CG5-10]MDY8136839.1 GYDIA family GHMP kinase [Aquimarina sp. 2201CG5-10]
MKTSYYSHGKLLLTGEYLVLDGVQALAIPTKKGQWLLVEENNSEIIHWKSLDEKGNCWFEANFQFQNDVFTQTDSNDTTVSEVSETLLKILNTAKQLNPNLISSQKGYTITTKLEFDRDWGLGSSSTVINNIAQWAEINAFELLEKSFGGSGYDVACAHNNTPILYKRNNFTPLVKKVDFDPPFKENLFFVHLNKKQSSSASIKHYQSLPLKDFDKAENAINDITSKLLECQALEEFKTLINNHEEIISKIIKTETVKSRLFSDYSGSVKSLGGWGGDFVLVTGTLSDITYFRNKGYHTIIPYLEMVL